jgi:hypothetical protein
MTKPAHTTPPPDAAARSELPQISDIVRSAFHHFANPLVLQITAFWGRAIARSAPAQ